MTVSTRYLLCVIGGLSICLAIESSMFPSSERFAFVVRGLSYLAGVAIMLHPVPHLTGMATKPKRWFLTIATALLSPTACIFAFHIREPELFENIGSYRYAIFIAPFLVPFAFAVSSLVDSILLASIRDRHAHTPAIKDK